MTQETRFVADIADIAGLRLECRICHASVLWPIRPRRQLMNKCPSCNTDLLSEGSLARHGLTKLVEGLDSLFDGPPEEKAPLSIRLEFKTDSKVATS